MLVGMQLFLFVVFFSNNIYFALPICIEHCFTNIELCTLCIDIYILRKTKLMQSFESGFLCCFSATNLRWMAFRGS